ncbi:MAG: undecaprenyl-diphosphatase, partial [Alphaproteobacteria bacterium]|nr:undecaprenyl-diphosphatase [Alphaproteobacteria bacterium]
KTAFLIGCFQACALMPGVSRSGATIAGGLALGLARPAAAEFSFFLAIPVMCAAVLYDTFKSWEDIIAGGYWGVMLAGFFAAFVTALAVLRAALYIIGRFGFVPFAWYRVLAGILILLFI